MVGFPVGNIRQSDFVSTLLSMSIANLCHTAVALYILIHSSIYMSEWECLGALSPLDCFSLFRNRWFVLRPLAYFPLGGLVFTVHYCKSGRGAHTLAGLSVRPYVTASWVMVVLCIVGQSHYDIKWTIVRLTYYLYKGMRPYCPFWPAICCLAERMKAFCSGFWLVSWSCSHCKWTAPDLEWSRAETTR